MVKFPFKIQLRPPELANKSMKVLLNNNLIDTPLPLRPDNRAFQYGDGVFETIWYRDQQIPLLRYHLARLRKGLEMLSLEIHDTRLKFLEDNIETLLQFNFPEASECVAKLMVWRHASERPGYHTDYTTCETLLLIRPFIHQELSNMKMGISSKSVVQYTPWSEAKTMNGIPYVIAARECTSRQLDDLVIPSADGQAAEAISANIFVFHNKEWITPPLSSGCIAGVMRAYILDNSWDFNCVEKPVSRELLESAEALALTSATGIRVASSLEGKPLNTELGNRFSTSIIGSLLNHWRT